MEQRSLVVLTAFERALARDLFPEKMEKDAYVALAQLKQSGELDKLKRKVLEMADPGTLPTGWFNL